MAKTKCYTQPKRVEALSESEIVKTKKSNTEKALKESIALTKKLLTGTPMKGDMVFKYEGKVRIKRILGKLEELWTIYEGMRFCQVTENYLITCHEHGGGCEFYTEDADLEQRLDSALEQAKRWKKEQDEELNLRKTQHKTSIAKVYKVVNRRKT